MNENQITRISAPVEKLLRQVDAQAEKSVTPRSWGESAIQALRSGTVPAAHALPLALVADAVMRGTVANMSTAVRANGAESRSNEQNASRGSKGNQEEVGSQVLLGIEDLLKVPEPVQYRNALLSAVRGARVAMMEQNYHSNISLEVLKTLSNQWGEGPSEKVTMIRNNGFTPGLGMEIALRDEVIEVAAFYAVTESKIVEYVDKVASASYPDGTSTAKFSSREDWEELLFDGRNTSLLAAYHGNFCALRYLDFALERPGSNVSVKDVLSNIAATTRGGMVLS